MSGVEDLVSEALAEVNAEKRNAAKAKIKAKLKEIDAAEQIVANLKMELEVLKRTV